MAAPHTEASIVITVARTGGFAGLRQQWRASSDDGEQWMPLIDACPWRSVAADTASRDRYVYLIEVKAPRKRRKASVPEASLIGPWRELVDRVTAASG